MSLEDLSQTKDYILKRRKLKGIFFETALPNEYLVHIGAKKVKPVLGGKSLRFYRKFLRVPASIQTPEFSNVNANIHFQGLGIEGFASWQIDPENPIQVIEEFLLSRIIENLPEIASKLNIGNYTILDFSGEGFSPMSKFIQEFISLLQTNKIFPQKSDRP